MEQDDNTFWQKAFFSDHRPVHPLRRTRHDVTAQHPEKIGDVGELWLTQLFQGKSAERNADDKTKRDFFLFGQFKKVPTNGNNSKNAENT